MHACAIVTEDCEYPLGQCLEDDGFTCNGKRQQTLTIAILHHKRLFEEGLAVFSYSKCSRLVGFH